MAFLKLFSDPNPNAEFIGDTRLFKSSPKAPAAPDPVATAQAQTATNKETAYWNAVLNNVNQVTPYGNLTFTQTGGGKQYNMDAYNKALQAYSSVPQTQSVLREGVRKLPSGTYIDEHSGREVGNPYQTVGQTAIAPKLEDYLIGDAPPQFTSTVNLNPQSQAILDAQLASERGLAELGNEQIGKIRQSVASPYSYSGMPAVFGEGDTAQAQARAEEAIMSRLNPQFERDQESIRTRLINQGIGQGSAAWNKEMNQFGQTQNDARMQAILQGQNYGRNLLQDSLTRRNQAIQEYDTTRNAPLNEYIAMTSGTQVRNPQFSSKDMGGIQPVDYAGLVNQQYQGQLNQYNNKVASNNATTGALFGLAGNLGGSFLGSNAFSNWLGK